MKCNLDPIHIYECPACYYKHGVSNSLIHTVKFCPQCYEEFLKKNVPWLQDTGRRIMEVAE